MTIILAIPQIRFHAYLGVYLGATDRDALEQKLSNLDLIGGCKHDRGRAVRVALIPRGMRTALRERNARPTDASFAKQ
jgi:hypothetical protein